MSDAVILVRDMAADASQKAANVVRPPEEQLAQIDEPTEENTWHEKPNMSKEDIKQRLKKGVSHPVSPPRLTISSHASQDKDSSTAPSIPETADGDNIDGISATPSERIRRQKYGQQAREYLSEKVPKERREQTIWRLKKMIIEIQGHADCKHTHDNSNKKNLNADNSIQTSKPLRLC